VNLPEKMIEKIDALVEKGYAGNRSDFIRIAIGEKLHNYNNTKQP